MSKYFTMSFDDGLEQDKEIIQIMKDAGLNCCTFNLNSQLFGKRQAIGRIGKIGYKEKSLNEGRLPRNGLLVKYHSHFRIPEDELIEVYGDVEVCAHGAGHLYASGLKEDALEIEITGDKKRLEEIFGRQIDGYVFPYGFMSEAVKNVTKKSGYLYTRGIKSTRSFIVPSDFLELQPTCSHLDKNLFRLLKSFLEEKTEDDRLFYMWGHGYELDYGIKTSSYDRLKRVLDMVAGREDVICCCNGNAIKSMR